MCGGQGRSHQHAVPSNQQSQQRLLLRVAWGCCIKRVPCRNSSLVKLCSSVGNCCFRWHCSCSRSRSGAAAAAAATQRRVYCGDVLRCRSPCHCTKRGDVFRQHGRSHHSPQPAAAAPPAAMPSAATVAATVAVVVVVMAGLLVVVVVVVRVAVVRTLGVLPAAHGPIRVPAAIHAAGIGIGIGIAVAVAAGRRRGGGGRRCCSIRHAILVMPRPAPHASAHAPASPTSASSAGRAVVVVQRRRWGWRGCCCVPGCIPGAADV